MTCRELLAIEHPEKISEVYTGGCDGCPSDFEYAPDPDFCSPSNEPKLTREARCTKCWDREVDEAAVERIMKLVDKVNEVGNINGASLDEIKDAIKAAEKEFSLTNDGPKVLDSGDRTEFPSGAVRDCRVGKGRCDLMPLDVVAEYIKLRKNDIDYPIILHINEFTETNDLDHLYAALDYFVCRHYDGETYTMLLEVAKQFEEGAKKYGDDNWRKGIPVHCYIDSAIRHYLKYLRGDKDEPHARAFCWNILCCIWTVKHIENGGESNGEGR